jgi:muconolactone delta-isomerase
VVDHDPGEGQAPGVEGIKQYWQSLNESFPDFQLDVDVFLAEEDRVRFDRPRKDHIIEFLVEFEVNIPDGTPESEVKDGENAEASAAARLVDEGHLLRVWKRPIASGETKVLDLYRADSATQLDGLVEALPLYEWMHVAVIPLEPHSKDPATARAANVGAGRREP